MRDCVQISVFCIRPGARVERTHCVNRHPFLLWIPKRLEDELVYNPVVSAKISFISHKNPVFYCRELRLVTNWFARDVILIWKKPPLTSVGLFFSIRETLCIQSLPVPFKVPVKFLIIMNTGPQGSNCVTFSCECPGREGPSASAGF